MSKFILSFFLASSMVLLMANSGSAQQGQPPSGGGWGEVIDADGNIQYSNLADLGEVQEAADWMPNAPFIDGQATYHEYATPSGNIVVMPTASTLFFMSLNPEQSGLNQAQSSLGNGAGVLEMMLAGFVSPSNIAGLGYSNPDDFYQSIIGGSANIWTFDFMGNFMLNLLNMSVADQNLYTTLLLYTQGNCSAVPGGCPPDLQEDLATAPPPADLVCPAPFITTSPIHISGGSGQGGKIAPPKPVVVGQDPEKRGVDVQVRVSIPPVIYHTFEKVRHDDLGCSAANGAGSGCPGHPGDPNYKTTHHVWYECIEHTQTFVDRLAGATVSIHLTEISRNWILTDLAQAYPGAHLIHPDFSFSFGGGGSNWTTVIPKIQTADPGDYTVAVTARSTGTPVSAPRQAHTGLGQFLVELVRVSLIEAP